MSIPSELLGLLRCPATGQHLPLKSGQFDTVVMLGACIMSTHAIVSAPSFDKFSSRAGHSSSEPLDDGRLDFPGLAHAGVAVVGRARRR
jgi:hypothetical protein